MEIIIGKKAKALTVLAITSYLIGVLSSKTIMSANILSKTFHSVPYLQEFHFWVCLFFFISAVFSFRDVSSTKWV